MLVVVSLALATIPSPSVASSTSLGRVSVDSSGNEAHGASFAPSISGNGRFVAFHAAVGLDRFDDGSSDIYLYDRNTGTTSWVSRSPCPPRLSSFHPTVSSDGRFVAFDSDNSFCTSSLPYHGLFLYDREHGHPNGAEPIDLHADGIGAGDGTLPSIDAYGRFAAFESESPSMAPCRLEDLAVTRTASVTSSCVIARPE